MHRATAVWPLALAAVLLAGGCASSQAIPDQRVTVKGLVVFDDDEPRLRECGTPRLLHLDGMTHGQLMHLRRDVAKLSRRKEATDGAVTAEFSGYLKVSGRKQTIEQTALLAMAPGNCVELPDPGEWDW